MATGELVSVREYLSTSYRPDCDYVDGVVLERHLGERDHARLQMAVSAFLYNRRKELGIHVFPEQRVQVTPTRFRVPDVCVVCGEEPAEQILTKPPLICIEVLSKDDRLSEIQQRVADFLNFGVPYVWILDPRNRTAYRCTAEGLHEVRELSTENPPILIPLAALFE